MPIESVPRRRSRKEMKRLLTYVWRHQEEVDWSCVVAPYAKKSLWRGSFNMVNKAAVLPYREAQGQHRVWFGCASQVLLHLKNKSSDLFRDYFSIWSWKCPGLAFALGLLQILKKALIHGHIHCQDATHYGYGLTPDTTMGRLLKMPLICLFERTLRSISDWLQNTWCKIYCGFWSIYYNGLICSQLWNPGFRVVSFYDHGLCKHDLPCHIRLAIIYQHRRKRP